VAASNAFIPLKALGPWRIGLYAAAMTASMFAVDIVVGCVLKNLFEEITPRLTVVIELSLYCVLGLMIAGCVYKIRTSIVILGIAALAFILVRLLLLRMLLDRLDSAIILPIIGYSAVEISTLVLSTLGCIWLLRWADSRFAFAQVLDIEEDVLDPETNTKYDMGVCGMCGARIRVAKERLFSIIPRRKRELHFCGNCGTFLRANPFEALLSGIVECIVCCIWALGMMTLTGHKESTAQNVFYLVMFFGIIDGGRRLFSGILGVFRAKKTP
jgi:hypothetical protein